MKASVPIGAILVLATVATTCAGAQEAATGGARSLLSWDARDAADQTVADGSGNGNDAKLVGSATWADEPPRIELDGRSALVGSHPVRPERITIEALFRADHPGGRGLQLVGTNFGEGSGGEGNPRQWVLEIRGAPPQPQGEYMGFLSFGVFGEDQQWHFALSNARLSAGWHHAAGSFDGNRVRLYLDGKPQRRFWPDPFGEYEGKINQPPDDVIKLPAAGANSTETAYGLDGAIALLRIYSEALSEDEITRSFPTAQERVPALEGSGERLVKRPKCPFKVLFSNDTTNILTCVSPYHEKGQPFTTEMLQATVDEVAGVDVHMLQPGLGWIPWWKSEEYPAEEHYRWFEERTGLKADPFGQYVLAGGDMVEVFVERCREKGQVPFVSLRLNDGHHLENVDTDHRMSAWCSRFYTEHPEYRIGPDKGSWDQHVQNWAIPEVRDHKFAFIREICENYDIGGFELDFMRHTSLFRLDETTFEERSRIITDFVARVRELLDRTARPGQHRWLCARVPCFLAGHDRLGLDLPAMVEAGLDMVNLSAFYFTQQQTDLPLVRELVPNAAIYLEMTHTTSVGPSQGGYDSFSYMRTTNEQFQTAAHLAYERGAAGVSLFNFVYFREHGTPGRGPFNEPPFHVLERLGQPKWLAKQPQWYVLAETWNTPPTPDRAMPKTFSAGVTHTIALDMAPRPRGEDSLLRLMTKEESPDCKWAVKLNGTDLEPTDFVRKPLDHPYEAALGEENQYACFACPRALVRDGLNKLEITLEEGGTVTLRYLDIVLP